MLRAWFASLVVSSLAFAQAAGKEVPLDEGWQSLPPGADTQAVTPLPEPPEQQPPEETPAQKEQKAEIPPTNDLPLPPVGVQAPKAVVVAVPPPPPEVFNEVSIFGAKTLARGDWAVGGQAGFPTFGVRVQRGFASRFDAGVGFESFYGMMNEAQLHARYALIDDGVELSAVAMGSFAQFVLPPQNDPVGARWITGHRNWNLAPGIVLSHHPASAHAPRLYLDARVLFAFDTQPYQKNPLGGVPQSVTLGWNVPVRMGGELPISPNASFMIALGFDIHGRPDDSVFMPVLSVGAVVGL